MPLGVTIVVLSTGEGETVEGWIGEGETGEVDTPGRTGTVCNVGVEVELAPVEVLVVVVVVWLALGEVEVGGVTIVVPDGVVVMTLPKGAETVEFVACA